MRTTIRALLSSVLLAGAACAAQAETLADALVDTYESSGLLEQNRAVLRAADEDVAQAVAALRPVVDWVLSANASNPRATSTDLLTGESSTVSTFALGDTFDVAFNLGLQASLTLFDSGARELRIDQQKETVLATRQALVNVEQQVLLRTIQAYLEVQRQGEFVPLRQNNVRVITQELQAAQDRFEVGEVTRTDVALAEARLAEARSQLAIEEGNLVQAREEFRGAVGRLPGDLAPVAPANIPYSLEQAREVALRNFPTIRQAQHQVAAAEIAIAATRTSLRPTITGSAQYRADQDLNESTTLSLNLSGPIYRGGQLASVVRQAQAQRDQTRANLLTTARDVSQDVGDAFALLEIARAGNQAFAQQVQASTIAFEGVREEATLGARTTLDVLDAEQELLNARANVISSEVDETLASYQILATLGLLTAQNLGLPVQVYDPTAYYNLVDDAPAAVSERGQALDRVLESIAR